MAIAAQSIVKAAAAVKLHSQRNLSRLQNSEQRPFQPEFIGKVRMVFCSRRLRVEPLESRTLLAADLGLSDFAAEVNRSLRA